LAAFGVWGLRVKGFLLKLDFSLQNRLLGEALNAAIAKLVFGLRDTYFVDEIFYVPMRSIPIPNAAHNALARSRVDTRAALAPMELTLLDFKVDTFFVSITMGINKVCYANYRE
jgi:hypothetical protein